MILDMASPMACHLVAQNEKDDVKSPWCFLTSIHSLLRKWFASFRHMWECVCLSRLVQCHYVSRILRNTNTCIRDVTAECAVLTRSGRLLAIYTSWVIRYRSAYRKRFKNLMNPRGSFWVIRSAASPKETQHPSGRESCSRHMCKWGGGVVSRWLGK